jgi:hypothetical protein
MKLLLAITLFIPLSIIALPLKLITKKGKPLNQFKMYGRTIDAKTI